MNRRATFLVALFLVAGVLLGGPFLLNDSGAQNIPNAKQPELGFDVEVASGTAGGVIVICDNPVTS